MGTDPRLLVVGAVWAVLVGGAAVGWTMKFVRTPRPIRHGSRFRTAEMGIVERAVFFAATVAHAPEVVAGWLVLKVAIRWGSWPDTPGVFAGFVIGTGLSLAFGVSGGLLAIDAAGSDVALALAIAFAPLVLCGLVLLEHLAPVLARKLMDPEAMEGDFADDERWP